jgi:hypothetical protein
MFNSVPTDNRLANKLEVPHSGTHPRLGTNPTAVARSPLRLLRRRNKTVLFLLTC